VAPKAVKWALVGPVLTACGGQKKVTYPTFQTVSEDEFSEVHIQDPVWNLTISRELPFRGQPMHKLQPHP
jgi:hypothetical protein